MTDRFKLRCAGGSMSLAFSGVCVSLSRLLEGAIFKGSSWVTMMLWCVHGIQGKAGIVSKEMSSIRVRGNMKLWVSVVFESGSIPSFWAEGGAQADRDTLLFSVARWSLLRLNDEGRQVWKTQYCMSLPAQIQPTADWLLVANVL